MKPRTRKKISILPQIKKFKQIIKKKKHEIKNRPVSKNLHERQQLANEQKKKLVAARVDIIFWLTLHFC